MVGSRTGTRIHKMSLENLIMSEGKKKCLMGDVSQRDTKASSGQSWNNFRHKTKKVCIIV